MFIVSPSYGDAFKCVDKKGNTVFQDAECDDNKKQTKIGIKKYVGGNYCTSICDSARTLCVTDLGIGKQNTNKALLLCEQARQACDARCSNPTLGRELENFTQQQRAVYEREVRNQQVKKNDAKYQAEREKRLALWEQKRKQRHCHRYEKKLEKIKARWERKQRSGWKPKDEAYFRRRIENAQDEVTIECR